MHEIAPFCWLFKETCTLCDLVVVAAAVQVTSSHHVLTISLGRLE